MENQRKIILFNSHKGGSGKSTLCFLIAKYLLTKKYKILVVEIDKHNRGFEQLARTFIKEPKLLNDLKIEFVKTAGFTADFVKYLIKQLSDYAFILVDGGVEADKQTHLQKLAKHVYKSIYIVPSDATNNRDNMIPIVVFYKTVFKYTNIFVLNNKTNDMEELKRANMILQSILVEQSSSMVHDKFIGYKLKDSLYKYISIAEKLLSTTIR